MIKSIESLEKFYIVKCSNLECAVLISSYEEAASKGLKNILKKYGQNTNLSFIMSVDLIKDSEIETRLFMTSNVLADLGHFKLAEELDSMSDFFLDKGKNPH